MLLAAFIALSLTTHQPAASLRLGAPWTDPVDISHVLPDYPRLQLVRFRSLNLHELLDSAVRVSGEPQPRGQQGATVTAAPFGRMPDGKAVEVYTLTSARGMQVRAITYGAIIQAIRVPDKAGRLGDVALGYDSLPGYLATSPYFGAVVGRYANRIAQGRFILEGRTYQLAANNGPNHLHGGVKGFDKVLWAAESFQQGDTVGVKFGHTSPNSDEGYPGTLRVHVTYTLTPTNELIVEYTATTDRPTPVNLSQHTYFNLAGEGNGDILGHTLTIHADRYTPVDATLIPTGELASVAETPFDFRAPTPIGARIDQPDLQLAEPPALPFHHPPTGGEVPVADGVCVRGRGLGGTA